MRDFSGKMAVLNGGGTGLGRRRWLFLLFMGFTSSLLRAEMLDCERLSDSQRRLCEELVRCSIIDSAAERTHCVSGLLQIGDRLAPDQVISKVIPVKPAPAKPIDATVIRQEPVASTARPAESGMLSKLLTPTRNRRTSPVAAEVPRRFSATVIEVRKLVRNRQLVLLDNQLLFEGDGPAFRIGDDVNVKQQGRFGNRYIIGRSKGRQLEFKHLRCNRRQGELGKDTRRKCTMLFASD